MGLSPDAVSYNTIISGFCRIGEFGKAYKLSVEMEEKNNFCPDGDTHESLMEGLSDEATFSSLMNDFCAEGEMNKALSLCDEMKDNGSLGYNVTNSVLINALAKSAATSDDKSTLLVYIFKDLLNIPTYMLYDILIENCSNNEFKNVVGLVKGFAKRGLVNEEARARDTMLEGNYKPDGAVYNVLIYDHCRSSWCYDVHKVYNMYTEMVHYGFAPHMFSVLALIMALYCHGRYNEMRWVIQNTLRSCNLNESELLKALSEIDVMKCYIAGLLNVLAEMAMDGL